MSGSSSSVGGIAIGRLTEERKRWRRDHPPLFFAKPKKKADGSFDLMDWECGIPGKAGTDWEGGMYKLSMKFTNDYPSKPPLCRFVPPVFHPNIFPSGTVCLSILNEDSGWKASITIKMILLGIQDLLDSPNPSDPASREAIDLFRSDRDRYDARIKQQAAAMGTI